MRITSFLRTGTLALALTAATISIGSAFAANEAVAAQPQSQQAGSTGPYDGSDYQASRNSFN
jgi:hypothetical protein